jgi:hypothetical protein
MAKSKKNTKDVENTAPKAPKNVYSDGHGLELLWAEAKGKEYRTPTEPPCGCVTEGRDLGPAITELIREGKVCVMDQLMRLAIFPAAGGPAWGPSANPLRNERNAMIEVFRHQRGAQQYGTTYTRALRVWQAVVPYPPAPNPDHPDHLVVDHYVGLLASDANHAQLPEGAKVVPATGKTDPEDGYRRWIEEYVAEVKLCAQRFSDNEELRVELQRLVDELNTFEPGTAEGRQFVEQWAGRVEGREGMGILRTGKERLIRRLRELMEEQAPEPIADAQTVTSEERLKWKVSTAAFVHIFNRMAALGYFDMPSKGGKKGDANTAQFARILLRAFEIEGRDGQPLAPERLRERLNGAGAQLADEKQAKFNFPETKEL